VDRGIMGTSSHVVTCRTIEEVIAAADADRRRIAMSQQAADRVTAILAAAGYAWAWQPADLAEAEAEPRSGMLRGR
jgi:hypothetical protein